MKKDLISKYLLLFGLTVSLRLIFLIVGFLGFDDTMELFLSRSDAGSYLAVSKGIYLGPDNAAMTPYDTRVFLGWPLMFGWGNWFGMGEGVLIVMTLFLAGLVPCIFFRLTDNFAASALLSFFTPAWILQTINPMGEAAYLALGLMGVLFFRNSRLFSAGLVLGLMFAVRPYAIVVIGGVFVALIWSFFHSQGRERLPSSVGPQSPVVGRVPATEINVNILSGVSFLLGCAVIPGFCGYLNISMYGDLFHQLHAYGRSLDDLNISSEAARALGNPSGHWGPPFWHIVSFPWKVSTPLWKVCYIFAHLIILVCGLIYAARKAWSIFGASGDSVDQIMFCWFVGNACLIICSGPYWGFHSFDRYFLWGWPPMLWLLKEHIRFRWITFVPLFLGSVGLVAFSLIRHFLK